MLFLLSRGSYTVTSAWSRFVRWTPFKSSCSAATCRTFCNRVKTNSSDLLRHPDSRVLIRYQQTDPLGYSALEGRSTGFWGGFWLSDWVFFSKAATRRSYSGDGSLAIVREAPLPNLGVLGFTLVCFVHSCTARVRIKLCPGALGAPLPPARREPERDYAYF